MLSGHERMRKGFKYHRGLVKNHLLGSTDINSSVINLLTETQHTTITYYDALDIEKQSCNLCNVFT